MRIPVQLPVPMTHRFNELLSEQIIDALPKFSGEGNPEVCLKVLNICGFFPLYLRSTW